MHQCFSVYLPKIITFDKYVYKIFIHVYLPNNEQVFKKGHLYMYLLSRNSVFCVRHTCTMVWLSLIFGVHKYVPSWRGSVRDIIFSFEVPFYYVCHSLQTLITFQVLLQKTWSIISSCVEDLPTMSPRWAS